MDRRACAEKTKINRPQKTNQDHPPTLKKKVGVSGWVGWVRRFCLWLRIGGALATLHERDAVAEGQGDALGLAADAHVPAQLAVGVALFLDAHVHQGVLAEYAHRVQVRRLGQSRK